ncbi:MAG: winged helix-turn-helix transcriptional regulator [Oscillospiraceae bacterium]|nr:winged helix-turn-helix transcriptional regulator [Oscillospiraceae bacterium]
MSYQETFKALSDKTRREILTLLRAGPLSVGEIGAHFDITGATLSHHLSILKQADLIIDSKKGKFIYYELNTTVLDDIIVWIKSLTKEA